LPSENSPGTYDLYYCGGSLGAFVPMDGLGADMVLTLASERLNTLTQYGPLMIRRKRKRA
jgi:hypothetical protein